MSLPSSSPATKDELKEINNPSSRHQPIKSRMKQRMQKVGKRLQKLNIARLIDEMEHDQELADQLEVINERTKEEVSRKELVHEATARCQAEIESHLEAFLAQHPQASYEEWIQDLHPENVAVGRLLPEVTQVDPRFYVPDSDHRVLWNQRVSDGARQVHPNSFQKRTEHAEDLLSGP